MNRRLLYPTIFVPCLLLLAQGAFASDVDTILANENKALGVDHQPTALIDDMAFLRRATVDLIGRIPTEAEIREFQAWPESSRREKLIDKLLSQERFADRWTVFFADMLRLRANSPGGTNLTAYVHEAIAADMPYDELARRLIKANGRPTMTPEAAFVLGDNADPLAMAAVTSQVFMGVRMGCAQCHDHPFDVWTREDFYGLAAFYGKTRRIENNFTNSVYTTETDQTSILWPPEDAGDAEQRRPMKPIFPIELASDDRPSQYIARLSKLREAQAAKLRQEQLAAAENDAAIDDLLDNAGKLPDKDARLSAVNVALEAKRDIRGIDINKALYRESELRANLAEFVTHPRNRYFSLAFVNRMWSELVGRGFVEPIDDFRDDNLPTHPETIDYLADEFVASGYSVKTLLRLIVSSDAYQRDHILGVDDKTREEMEGAFLATPMRRMLSEALYDSVVTAGHLFDVKHPQGANMKTVESRVQVRIEIEPETGEEVKKPTELASITGAPAGQPAMPAMQGGAMQGRPLSGYDLEKAIELDFNALLSVDETAPELDKLEAMSQEELEAQRMMADRQARKPGAKYKYVTKTVTNTYDDNPQYNSSMRMASPAPEGHFLRVFGQPARDSLGDLRDRSPSMRQALMIMNGRLTHEAARVGPLEPMHRFLEGPKQDLDEATRLAYREILTREPTADELAEAKAIMAEAGSPLEGMADLRWVLLNCHEFRFIP